LKNGLAWLVFHTGDRPDDMGKGTCICEPIGFSGNLFDRDGNVIEGMRLYDELSDLYLV